MQVVMEMLSYDILSSNTWLMLQQAGWTGFDTW